MKLEKIYFENLDGFPEFNLSFLRIKIAEMFNLTSFTKLDISNYKLQNFSISKLDILREMSLSNNNLTFYELSESPNLIWAFSTSLETDSIKSLTFVTCKTWPNWICPTTDWPILKSLLGVTSLVFLHVSNNKFETFILHLAPNLSELNFSDNNLWNFDFDTFLDSNSTFWKKSIWAQTCREMCPFWGPNPVLARFEF